MTDDRYEQLSVYSRAFQPYFLAWWIAAFAFFVVSVGWFHGAAALPGVVESGHYYLVGKGEWVRVEVSRGVYLYAVIHGLVFAAGWAVTMILSIPMALHDAEEKRRARNASR